MDCPHGNLIQDLREDKPPVVQTKSTSARGCIMTSWKVVEVGMKISKKFKGLKPNEKWKDYIKNRNFFVYMQEQI